MVRRVGKLNRGVWLTEDDGLGQWKMHEHARPEYRGCLVSVTLVPRRDSQGQSDLLGVSAYYVYVPTRGEFVTAEHSVSVGIAPL